MSDSPDIPAQSRDARSADEHVMSPTPDYTPRNPGSKRLDGRIALITGGDSGIGRAVATSFLFLVCSDPNYRTGQTLHPNGGSIVGA